MAGLALLSLRVITAVTLGYSGYCIQQASAATGAPAFNYPRLVSFLLPLLGVLMIFGFATVISGILSCGLLLVSFDWLNPRSNGLFAMAAGLSLVLMLLGPGAYSLDARFYGWRRIEIARRTPNRYRDDSGGLVCLPQRTRDLEAFAKTWDQNLSEQGFLESFRTEARRHSFAGTNG